MEHNPDNLTVAIPVAPDGKLNDEIFNRSVQLVEHMLTRAERVVDLRQGKQWEDTIQQNNTVAEAWEAVLDAIEPIYTTNTPTANLGIRFFGAEDDITPWLSDMIEKNSGPAKLASEDVLIGSPGSGSLTHLDHAPCVPTRVTVLYPNTAKKEVCAPLSAPASHMCSCQPHAPRTPDPLCPCIWINNHVCLQVVAWKFNPNAHIPADVPLMCRNTGGNKDHLDAQSWERTKQYALEQGGWVKVLTPGKYFDLSKQLWPYP